MSMQSITKKLNITHYIRIVINCKYTCRLLVIDSLYYRVRVQRILSDNCKLDIHRFSKVASTSDDGYFNSRTIQPVASTPGALTSGESEVDLHNIILYTGRAAELKSIFLDKYYSYTHAQCSPYPDCPYPNLDYRNERVSIIALEALFFCKSHTIFKEVTLARSTDR